VAGSTTKKVLIRRFDREPLTGYVSPMTYLQPNGVELLSTAGAVSVVPYEEIKVVCFVKDFDESGEPEQKVFLTRPKMDGLWVRMQLRDAEILDGILSNNLLQVAPEGFTVVPPDPNSNNQKLFIPRAALRQIQVVGVVGSPLKSRKAKPASKDQIGLFE
jgi:hypothetical protein